MPRNLHAAPLAANYAFGVDHETLGQAIQVIATPAAGDSLDTTALLADCRNRMPAYMVPASIIVRPGPLPRNPNGKIDRKALASEFLAMKVAADE